METNITYICDVCRDPIKGEPHIGPDEKSKCCIFCDTDWRNNFTDVPHEDIDPMLVRANEITTRKKTLALMIEAERMAESHSETSFAMEAGLRVVDLVTEYIESGIACDDVDPVADYHYNQSFAFGDWQYDVDDDGYSIGVCPKCNGEARCDGNMITYLRCLECGVRGERID